MKSKYYVGLDSDDDKNDSYIFMKHLYALVSHKHDNIMVHFLFQGKTRIFTLPYNTYQNARVTN